MHKTRWYPLNQKEGSETLSKRSKTKKISLDEVLNRRCNLLLKQMQTVSDEKITSPANERDFEVRITL
jgi:hypothetical protein